MKLISFGKINIQFLIPIFGGLIRLISRLILDTNSKHEILEKNPFLFSIFTAIGMILAFIPYLIIKYRTKKSIIYSKDLTGKSKLNLELVYNDIYEQTFKQTRFNKYKLIVLSSVFDFFETLIVCLFTMNCLYNVWIFDILFMSIFSYYLLKTKLYKHQYLSIIIIILLGLSLNVIEYFKIDETENKLDFFEISMKLLGEIILSLNMIIIKYNMEKNFCSPYEICIWEGLIGTILHIICLSIINELELTISDIKYPDNIIEYINNYDGNDVFVCIMIIIVSCIYNIFLFLTCDYFSPCHTIILLIINQSYFYIKMKEDIILNILGLFILILIFFILLIFIEIIEINCLNISYNTKKNIEKRSDIDLLDDNDNDDIISFDDNRNDTEHNIEFTNTFME